MCQKCDFDEIESLTLPPRTKQKPVIAIEEIDSDDYEKHDNHFEDDDDLFQGVDPNLVFPPPRSCTPPPRSYTPPPSSSVTPPQQSPPITPPRPPPKSSSITPQVESPSNKPPPPSSTEPPVDPPSQFADPQTLEDKIAQLKVVFKELPKRIFSKLTTFE